jgi:hypothetical protein
VNEGIYAPQQPLNARNEDSQNYHCKLTGTREPHLERTNSDTSSSMLCDGELHISPPLDPAQVRYLQAFSESRRVKRDVSITGNKQDPLRETVGLPVGKQGEFYVAHSDADKSDVLDDNTPPSTQPALLCCWTVSDDGTLLYNAEETMETVNGAENWIPYLVRKIFRVWNRELTGEITFFDENDLRQGVPSTVGFLKVQRNRIRRRYKQMMLL